MSGYSGDLSKTQQLALNEFKSILTKDTLAEEENLLRFLRARSFDVDGAYRQYMATLKWRKDNGIDQLLDKPRPLDKEMKNIMSSGFHSYDKQGRPAYFEYTGRTDVQALIQLPLDQIIRRHVWNCEKQIARMKEISQEIGKNVETMVHIHDMTGASQVLRKALNLFKKLAKLDQEYYPERMGKIFIVNTTWIFPVLWKCAGVFLDSKTRSKCVVLKTGEIKKLLEYFDPESLPKEFGGSCNCEGGCLPPIPKHMRFLSEAPSLTEQYTIGPKETLEKSLECTNDGDSVAWCFTTSKDIKFGVTFKPKPHSGWSDKMNDIPAIWVLDVEPKSENDSPVTGYYTPPCPGICTLVWDNLDSKWSSRTIKFNILVEKEANDSEEENGSNGIKRLSTVTYV
ncbi:sec14 cytosolic factor [Exaiptasia diaphana]|uniref:CRAL-TRIO domain-containing protein n=1 Tax=Exaiptasia diaphana TaxID=2652724 RepID=A0A913XCA6_EXADI|nr:sec14 cytosolic factor [Exaiptasia diaphana]KXJ29799.1 Phosphatidylinositol/phosphatidylcholine transfer protein SFH1 [Exaiptasia diaphana]